MITTPKSSAGARAARRRALRTRDTDIAIIGFGCRLPGGISNAQRFWSLVRDGRSAVGALPADRFPGLADDSGSDYGRLVYARQAGIVPESDCFDPEFFGISPREALHMDPQERMVLQVAWEALEDAAIDPLSLAGSNTGTFVGSFANEYPQHDFHGCGLPDLERYNPLHILRGMLAGRLAYTLDLHGPTLQLDTACSSSLVGVHLAAQSLRSGECDLAVAGGVNHLFSPRNFATLCRIGVLSREGACRTLDASADGYVRSEGCALVVLKRAADARRDGDTLYGFIRGSAVNHDGRTNGPAAPNGVAQEAVIRAALRHAAIDPRAVSYVELHGTGTILGDPIEVHALQQVYGARPVGDAPLYIGSVKANLGHTESAAGVCGLMKAVLALRHGLIPAQLNFTRPNPHISWSELPFAVPRTAVPLEPGRTHLAAVSAFGMTGTNVHLLVEAAIAVPRRGREARKGLLTLSAKTSEGLHRLAREYVAWFGDHPEARFVDVCHTTHVGRSHFDSRLAVVAASGADAAEKLLAFLDGRPRPGVWVGDIAPAPASTTPAAVAAPPSPLEEGVHEMAARLYVTGESVPWADVATRGARRVGGLPTYAFAQRRFTLAPVDPGRTPSAGFLVPLDDAAAPGRTCYSLAVGAAEPSWIHGHTVQKQEIVAGSAWLALLAAAAHRLGAGNSIEFRDVVFGRMVNAAELSAVTLRFDRNVRDGGVFEICVGGEAGGVAVKGRFSVSDAIPPRHVARPDAGPDAQAVAPAQLYESIARAGIGLSAEFRRLMSICQGDHWASGEITGPSGGEPWLLHPGVLESALQLLNVAAHRDWASTYVPVSVNCIRIAATSVPAPQLHAAVLTEPQAGQSGFTGRVVIHDPAGTVVAELNGIRIERIGRASASAERDAAAVDTVVTVDEVRRHVCEAIARILEQPLSEVRADRNLLDLGVESLALIELAEELGATFGFEIATASLLQARTPAGIAQLVLDEANGASAARLPVLS